jgi:hypothetical protein
MASTPLHRLLACYCFALATVPAISLSQDSETSATDPESDDPSRETDISEDNYRRFMELDDRRLERPAFPVSAVQPTSGLQKMGQLPESSQKHLRNQLRGIILSRGAWTPAERDATYPFVPSAEARGDAQLLRQEAEAWNELVNEYHDREAAILAGATGQPTGEGDGTPSDPRSGEQAAGQAPGSRAQQQASSGTGTESNPGTNGAQDEDGKAGQQGRDGAQGESGSDGGPDGKSGAESSTSPPRQERPEAPEWVSDDTAATPTDPGNDGVEQSASDYLQARGLARSATAELQGAQDRPAPASVERESRWGEAAQSLLDDPDRTTIPSRPSQTPSPAEDRDEPGVVANSLTREQLRDVRGVTEEGTPPEDAFVDFIPGVSTTSAPPGEGQEASAKEEDEADEQDNPDGGGERRP